MQEIKDRDVKQEEILKQWIQESSHIVFFGGAGGIDRKRNTGFPESGRLV